MHDSDWLVIPDFKGTLFVSKNIWYKNQTRENKANSIIISWDDLYQWRFTKTSALILLLVLLSSTFQSFYGIRVFATQSPILDQNQRFQGASSTAYCPSLDSSQISQGSASAMEFSSLSKSLNFNLPIKLGKSNFLYWKTQIVWHKSTCKHVSECWSDKWIWWKTCRKTYE